MEELRRYRKRADVGELRTGTLASASTSAFKSALEDEQVSAQLNPQLDPQLSTPRDTQYDTELEAHADTLSQDGPQSQPQSPHGLQPRPQSPAPPYPHHGLRSQPRARAHPQYQPQPDAHPHPRLSHQATTNIPSITSIPTIQARSNDLLDDPPPYTPLIPPRTSSITTSNSKSTTPLSQLIKQHRRRCGGIFRPVEPEPGSGFGSGPGAGEGGHGVLEFEYEWPYGQNIDVTNETDGMDGVKGPTGAVGLNDSNGADYGQGLNRFVGIPNIDADGESTGEATGNSANDAMGNAIRNGDTNDKGLGHRNANTTGRGSSRGRACHPPSLTIDTGAVNEIYFRTTQGGRGKNPEPLTPIRENYVQDGKDLFDDRRRKVRRYDFECDVEGLGIDVGIGVAASARDATELAETREARNRIQDLANTDANANADRKSTRSASVYSQWSLESDQSGYNVIRNTHRASYLQNRRAIDEPTITTGPQSRVQVDKSIKRRIRDANESWSRLKQKREAGKTDDKSIRSVSSRLSGIRRVASGFGSRTQSVVGRAVEMFGSFRIPRRRGEKVEGDRVQEAKAQGDDGVGSLHSSERAVLPEADGLAEQVARIGLDGGRSGRPEMVRRY